MVSRAERSLVGDWWWTIDKALIAALGVLMTSGVVLLMAGGPPVAQRLGLDTFHFVNRQAVFLVPAVLLMLAVSFLTPRLVRRVALVVYVGSLALVLAALEFGPEIKGANRWIYFGPFGLQPSEFLKPAFVILAAWAFSEKTRSDMPGTPLAILLLPLTIVPLILQPDFGQTMLVTIVWAGLFFIAGLHWIWVIGLGGAGALGIFAAYELLPHVRARIERFLSGDASESFQVETALQSFASGGWFGRGPGEGTVKRILPDAHTDFIFAVTAEEFGIAVCLAIVSVYAFIVLRGLLLAHRAQDAFCRMAVAGLVLMFGLQASINMMVNLHLVPAKGMTLPFISYGGSSLLSLALATGFLIALTRRRPAGASRAEAYGGHLVERPA
ncbi:MAG: FtsW/RodA/SpoVE family cell cycle protein [Salinarimonas sp.]